MINLKIHILTQEIAHSLGQNESILLNQILYWLSKCGREIAGQQGKWIYNSLADWHKQFGYWSMYKLRKTIKSLEDLGLIKSIKINAKKWNHTKWYAVDYNQYKKLLKQVNDSLQELNYLIEDIDILTNGFKLFNMYLFEVVIRFCPFI